MKKTYQTTPVSNNFSKIALCALSALCLLFGFCPGCNNVQAQEEIVDILLGDMVEQNTIRLYLSQGNEDLEGNLERKRTSTDNQWEVVCVGMTGGGYEDILDVVCKDTLCYRFVLTNSDHPCMSNELRFVVGDTQIPDMPLNSVFSISADNSQNAVLSYDASQAPDVMGYVVCKGNPCIALDTVWGRENTSYTCLSCDINTINEIAVMSFDSCYNTSLRSDKLNNIVLQAEMADCSGLVELSWNDYLNMPSGLATYEVRLRSNSTDMLIASTQNTYASVNISSLDDNIAFYVRAKGNDIGYEANSNMLSLNKTIADTLDYIFVRNVSVNQDNHSTTIKIELDNSKQVSFYQLYRATDNENFVKVQETPYNGESIFYLQDLLPEDACGHVYSYYLQAPDLCNNTFTRSNTFKTIKLSVTEVDAGTNRLSWTPFTYYPVSRYEIYRYEQGDGFPSFIATSTVPFYDDVHQTDEFSADKQYYYVTAVQQTAVGENDPMSSSSAHEYLQHQSLFFAPNAFDPTEGLETSISTFRPSCRYIKKETYDFRIYNRWGTEVFSTTEVEKGWDGKQNGKLCAVGVYVYKVQYINSEGKLEKHSGAFMLYD